MATEPLQIGDRVFFVTAGREGIIAGLAAQCALVDFGGSEKYWCLTRSLRRVHAVGPQPQGTLEKPPAPHVLPRNPTPAGDVPGRYRCLKVLLVGDNDGAADSMARVLKAIGHQAIALHHPDSLKETASSFKPDVVFVLPRPPNPGFLLGPRLKAALDSADLPRNLDKE